MRVAPFLAGVVGVGFAALTASSARAEIAKGPWVQRVTPTSAVIRFELDAPGPATVELGLEKPASAEGRDAGKRSFASADKTRLHSVTIDGLSPATRYAYEIRASGGTKLAALTTAPKEDQAAPFRFLVYGDNRTDDAAHAAVVRGMTSVKADFMVNTGDLVANGSSPSDWQTFFDIEAPLLRERPIFSCVGNHELLDGSGLSYVRYFGRLDAAEMADASARPAHLDDTFRWGNTRFFLMNGMVGWRSGADRAWLDEALSASDGEAGLTWRIVVLHHGPWSSGPHGGNALLHQAGIVPLFRSHKIDLVISGHDHMYERGWAEGMAYMVSGGGGAPTYRIKNAKPSARKFEGARHFVEASVSSAAIAFAVTRPDGSSIERCALRKDVGWDCDEPPAKSAPSAAGSSGGAPAAASRCACRAVGGPSGAAPGALSLLALACALAARRARGSLR